MFSSLFVLLSFVFTSLASHPHTVTHDATFTPDIVLSITHGNATQSCLPAKTIVLANGTSPGPELRIRAGKTYWIRVYNDMHDANLTMVRLQFTAQNQRYSPNLTDIFD